MSIPSPSWCANPFRVMEETSTPISASFSSLSAYPPDAKTTARQSIWTTVPSSFSARTPSTAPSSSVNTLTGACVEANVPSKRLDSAHHGGDVAAPGSAGEPMESVNLTLPVVVVHIAEFNALLHEPLDIARACRHQIFPTQRVHPIIEELQLFGHDVLERELDAPLFLQRRPASEHAFCSLAVPPLRRRSLQALSPWRPIPRQTLSRQARIFQPPQPPHPPLPSRRVAAVRPFLRRMRGPPRWNPLLLQGNRPSQTPPKPQPHRLPQPLAQTSCAYNSSAPPFAGRAALPLGLLTSSQPLSVSAAQAHCARRPRSRHQSEACL